MDEPAPARRQLRAELRHWRDAIGDLADLDVVAAPAAWEGLELYLRAELRTRLQGVVAQLTVDAAGAEAGLAAGRSDAEMRAALLRIRARSPQVETILDFYGDAVNTRTNPTLAAVLRGLDTIAVDSLEVVLKPLGLPVPPVLVYLDKGLGAAILRAGVRLWDGANPSPVAAVKMTRHNLLHPTALLHETGHQVAHQTGWTAELADALRTVLGRRSRVLGELWASWASEVAADVYAFALAGCAPLPALANVVDGSTPSVLRIVPGDPHPFPWVRVMLNAALCRSWYGAGPWDAIAGVWAQRHPLGRSDGAAAARLSMAAMGDVVDLCTRRPMQAFGGRPISALSDPRQVSPVALSAFAQRCGPTLLQSPYLRRRESLRVLAWLTTRSAASLAEADRNRLDLRGWLASFDSTPAARAA